MSVKIESLEKRFPMLYNYTSPRCTTIAPHVVRSYDLMLYNYGTPCCTTLESHNNRHHYGINRYFAKVP